MKIVIVIPTYKEADNIGRMIDALEMEFLKETRFDYHILVVEGNSPDGTADIVKQKMEKYPNVHLLMEQKKAGLGAAYMYGFRYAIDTLNADVLVEMDADFQHDPKDINRLVGKLAEGNDYVIGSRFTKGGSIPEEWALYRKMLSIGGSLFSKAVLGIWRVSDFTSGFKASRVKGFVDKLDMTSNLSAGFAYKIDLLFRMHRMGAKIAEIPIQFGLRDRGVSKMENNNFMDSLKVVVMLRVNEKRHFIKFIIVGFIGLFVDWGLFNGLRLIPMDSRNAALLSGLIAMMATFTLNNFWSFNERKIKSTQGRLWGFIIYIVSSSIPILVRSKFVYLANIWFGDTFIVVNIAFMIGIIFGLVWNFTVYSKIIWRRKVS